MKLDKAILELELDLARSRGEAQRLIKQGSIMVGGCISPCNKRLFPFTCSCGGWRKITNPAEEIAGGEVIRIKDGSWRLLAGDHGKMDQLPGIGWVPAD